MTDLELLQRVAAQDGSAFEQFHRRYHQRLLRFALRITRRLDVAEEVVNDTMVVVWQKAGSFGGRSRVSSWLMGIAYHLAMKALKRLGKDACHESLEDHDMIEAPSIEQAIQAKHFGRRLGEAIACLSPAQRAVVELTYFHGYRYSEIAELVGCPPETVKTRVFHARAKLRTLLAKWSATNEKDEKT